MWLDLQSMYANLGCWVEHIVHIDGVTGSSPVATTGEPNRKVRLVMYSEKNEHREPSETTEKVCML